MNLDRPPMVEHLLLESPWAVMAVLCILAAVLAMTARRRRSKTMGVSAVLTLALACGVFSLAKAVTTDREQLIENTLGLVYATAPLDQAQLDRLIDPTAIVSGPTGTAWLNYAQINPRLRSTVRRFGIKSQRVRNIQALAHDTGWGESSLTVRTEMSSAGGVPVNTGWYLSWRKNPGGAWRVVEIRWVLFNGQAVSPGMVP